MRWQVGRVVGGRRRRVCGRDRNPMDVGVDVDAGGVRVHYPQARLGARATFFLLIAGCHSGLHKGNGGTNPRPRAQEIRPWKQFLNRGHASARHQGCHRTLLGPS